MTRRTLIALIGPGDAPVVEESILLSEACAFDVDSMAFVGGRSEDSRNV